MSGFVTFQAADVFLRAGPLQRVALTAQVAVLLLIVYFAPKLIYNLHFHPLAKYPGPLLARCSRLWTVHHILAGRQPLEVAKLHRKYGPVIRIAVDELVFESAEAWKDIYGIRPGQSEIPKDPSFYLSTAAGIESIIAAPAKQHGKLRRLLAHGFSERALREQVDIIQSYVDLLIARMRQESGREERSDMVKWYNFFTFDVIGNLAFAKDFDCLRTGEMHPWIDTMTRLLAGGDWRRAANKLPTFKPLLKLITPKWAKEGYQMHNAFMKEKALSRLNLKTDRLDFMTRMASPDSGLEEHQFIASADTVILGGSETTSTLLSGCTYFLLKNPKKLGKLVDEIRSEFHSEDEIDLAAVNSLPYMLACLDEAFRLYPPVAGSLPRRTSRDEVIDGNVVPPGTILSICQWSINRRPDYWTRVDSYIPERWLGEAEFADDKRSAMQPFSTGARNCIGRNLAYVEMRLVLARILFNFDIEPTPQTEGWTNQVLHLLWEKPPLWVKLIPRHVPNRAGVMTALQGKSVQVEGF